AHNRQGEMKPIKSLAFEEVLAQSITRTSSHQAYYTISLLADHERVTDAYCAYAYLRWVDDIVDASSVPTSKRIAFLERQKSLLNACYQGKLIQDPTAEEKMLIRLVQNDHQKYSGLQIYLRNMMKVMEFDAERRGRLISEVELDDYTRCLASAVTEAMHYFIGHGSYSPNSEARYLAVSGAHIVHMLRDAYEDLQSGYYNIPHEVLEAAHIQPHDIQSQDYRAWVQSRVQLARQYFKAGKAYIAQVENMRCKLAGFAYIARFEWLLNTFEREAYVLRPEYNERKSLGTKCRIAMLTLSSIINSRRKLSVRQSVVSHLWRKT
ncbi:MAG TPA: squalene/phytoene synthase family protein, partial [Anaerolineales bacterium]|nr:squalene/phytoene synthase family protein [Anaerolineales bacterium]